MTKFIVNMSKMYAAEMEVEVETEEEAEVLAKHRLNFEDTSAIVWEPISKSVVIEEVYEA